MDKKPAPIKVLLAKVSLDGHDRGIQVVMMGLRDRGMEVIYTGLRQTAEQVVEVALQEDVNVIGLSSLSGGHNTYLPRVAELAKARGIGNVLLIAGGIIPQEDIPHLKSHGIKAVFGPGTSMDTIASFIRNELRKGSGQN